MRSLEVLPASLPPLAAALSDFAATLGEVPAVPGVGGELQPALDAFARSWSVALGFLAQSAQVASTEVVHAAELYTQLEDLLVPDGLR